MKIEEFILENWLNPACGSKKNEIYLGGSCVSPITVEELFELTGESLDDFIEELKKMDLGYPRFEGTPRTKNAISKLYKDVNPDEVILVHGGTGANNTVIFSLLEPTDNIISIMPNYQQFNSLPKSLGVEVREIKLKAEAGYKLDLYEVSNAVDNNTKAIMFTNPNNPTGSILELEEMKELVKIADSVGAWIVCDEMYRGLKNEYMPSFADIYDKVIVTCSSSKIYSMAGTRVGWIVCRDEEMRQTIFNYRSYDSICGGVFDEWIFAIALEHSEKIISRSRKIVSQNKLIIDDWLNGHKNLKQYAESYGTTYLISYKLDINAEKFCNELLNRKGVLVCHGDCFYMPHTFRMSLANGENLEEGLRRIDEYIDELLNERSMLDSKL
ncbi:MAG: aminotransferase class I/II-fold pyridoxal phosphate-dependent enzyme [Peptostreptococcaceae bacterium]|nr:aminotransferase class I/II-fold pyridoxal phosphate-dependent enzyme [Peptostreptococcaceae bacterium]